MAKQTLLQLTQAVLDAISSDSVNSISDTEEALQVVGYIKEVYNEMTTGKEWPHLNQLSVLNSAGDSSLPNYLVMPNDVDRVHFIMYNRRKSGDSRDYWKEMKYLYPDEFIMKCSHRDNTESNVTQVTTVDSSVLNIINDTPPTYYTSFDDNYLVFDSWDSDVESTLRSDQSQIFCQTSPGWTLDDNFIPDLPAKLFPKFLAESISVAAYRINEEADAKAEQMSSRQGATMSRDAFRAQKQQRYPNYGRQSRKATASRRPRIFGDRS